MTGNKILEKYKKYEVQFNNFDDIIEIKQPIEVKKFVEFKLNLIRSRINYNDILVIDRRNRKK